MSVDRIMSPPVLKVSGLGKIYSRHTVDTRKRLGIAARHAIFQINHKTNTELSGSQFWALEDISFELSAGEAIGIIGLNGSGKTTLLRILAGQILPDIGHVEILGSTAAMIDLQAGFQPKASGFDNVFLRAAALGFSKTKTMASLDEIIEFSELGEAIHAPLASYSAGMKMRLAFSIMATVSPDLLLIDEVLAVGDFRFRQKCLAKIRQMRAKSAFVFVSHSMSDVSSFCDHVIVMHKGKIFFAGPPKEAIEAYESIEVEAHPSAGTHGIVSTMGPVFENSEAVKDVEHYWCNADGCEVHEVAFDDRLYLHVSFRPEFDIRNLIMGIPVWALNKHYTTGLSTQITSDRFHVKAGRIASFVLEIQGGYLNPGMLKSMLTILDGPEFLYRRNNPDLKIHPANHPTWGAVTVPHAWREIQTVVKN